MESTKGKKAMEKWSHDENVKFLAVWREMKDRLKTCANKTEVYLSFKNKLKEVGVDRTVDQIKKKISNFKEGFKRNKPGITGSSPSNWPYYEEMAELLGSSHYYNQDLAHTVDSSISGEEPSTQSLSSPPTPTTSFITEKGLKRKRKREELAKEKEELKEAIEEMKRIGSETITEFRNGQQNIERQVADIGRNIDSLVQLLTTQAQSPTRSFGSIQNYFHL